MEQMNLEGDNLGEKHRSYNILVKATAADEAYKLSELNYYESDVHNMLRIDVACVRRDVDYLLQVLECEDILYVSRAIKGSNWLVTEEQYSHIVNPEYLNKELLPLMMTKAKNMLLASIRNNLKDSARVEAFFNYYKDNFGEAQSWLRHCSIDFIEEIVVKHADEISFNTMKHLCMKSSKILKCYMNSHSRDCHLLHRYLLQAEREEAIQILDLIYSANQRKPIFGKKFTRSLMKRYSDDIIDNFQKYYYGIHMPTFVKYLDKEKIEHIMLRDIDNDFMKPFYNYDNLKHFLRYMPETSRLKLVKAILSESVEKTSYKNATNFADLKVTLGYKCYEFVPFDNAFLELKQIISAESSPYKRISMFNVLIHSAKRNSQHIQILLDFYRTHFIAEPVEHKIKFLNKLITPNIIHRLNSHLWSILGDIYISMDLFTDACKDIPKCLEAFIIYKLVQGEHTPEEFVNKVNCNSFLDFRPYLSVSEQKIVLNYVYDACFAKILKTDIGNEEEMEVMVDTIKQILVLLRDWNKGPDEYPWVANKIREMIKIKANNNWSTDLSALYHIHKLFRKQLYDVSLDLCVSDETCFNVLKNDASILLNERNVLVDKCSNHSVLLKRTLGKIRTYWPKSTVQQWIKSYLTRLHLPVGQKTTVKSICTLLDNEEAMSILIKKYAPGDTNTNDEKDNVDLRQNIIRCLHLLRPLVNNKALFLYAKPEYISCLLPALDVILRYQSSNEFWKSILSFLTYEHLRKYAAKIAISKLKNDKFDDKNNIKVPLIKKILDVLNKEEKVDVAADIWDLLIILYGDLSSDEKKKVQISMYTVHRVNKPIEAISFVKLYEIYKLFGPKSESIDEFVINTANDLYKYLSPAFKGNEIIKIATHLLSIGIHIHESACFVAKFIMNCDSEKEQIARYEKYLAPIMADCIGISGTKRCESSWCYPCCSKHKIYKIVDAISEKIFTSIAKFKCIIPIQLCAHIKNKLETDLNIEEGLEIFIIINHIVIFLEKFRDHIERVGKVFVDEDPYDEWNKFCLDFVNSVAQGWIQYYKPLLSVSGSFHVLLSRSCMNIFQSLRLNDDFKLSFVKQLLSDKDNGLLYCIAIDILRHVYIDDNGESEKDPLNDLVSIRKQTKGELVKMISSHPSIEVQVYYNHYANKM